MARWAAAYSASSTSVHLDFWLRQVLAVSRIMVAWQPVGMAMGAYDMAVRYLGQRRQFGAPLSSFQLSQDKLARMLANIQVRISSCSTLGQLFQLFHQSAILHASFWCLPSGKQRRVLTSLVLSHV